MYARMYVCMYACMHAWYVGWLYVCVYVCVCVYASKHGRMHAQHTFVFRFLPNLPAQDQKKEKKREHTQTADKPDNGTVARGQVSLEDKHHLYGCLRVCARERERVSE